MEENNTSKVKKMNLNTKVLPWIVMVVALAAGIGGTMYYKNRADKVEADPQSVQQEKNQAETDRVLTKLTKVLMVEETDKPTVARVEDPEKLKKSNETFYKNIQTGDYLIIYPKRAVVYRESNNQIINIAPIINTADLQQKKDEQTTQPAAEAKP